MVIDILKQDFVYDVYITDSTVEEDYEVVYGANLLVLERAEQFYVLLDMELRDKNGSYTINCGGKYLVNSSNGVAGFQSYTCKLILIKVWYPFLLELCKSLKTKERVDCAKKAFDLDDLANQMLKNVDYSSSSENLFGILDDELSA